MSRRNGGFRVLVALVALFGLAAQARAESPHVNYLIHCSGCHLQDGSGKAGEVPNFNHMIGRFAAFPEGRAFLVRVPGTSQSPLGNPETAELLNWILATFAGVTDVAPFTADEVRNYRANRMSDVSGTRRLLVEKISGSSGY